MYKQLIMPLVATSAGAVFAFMLEVIKYFGGK